VGLARIATSPTFELQENYVSKFKDSMINAQYDKFTTDDIRNSDGEGGFPTLFNQPYLIIKPNDPDAIKYIKKFDSRLVPAGSTAQDIYRIGKFEISSRGILFNIMQAVYQKANARVETRAFNPLSIPASIVPGIHISRVLGATILQGKVYET